jgi:serine/threonine protein kinase
LDYLVQVRNIGEAYLQLGCSGKPYMTYHVCADEPNQRALLDWNKRLAIIEGIAQGLLYLHKHSRLRVTHRDLKASNVLLDHNMNPKISDFGLAKIFSSNDIEGNTKRVAGT